MWRNASHSGRAGKCCYDPRPHLASEKWKTTHDADIARGSWVDPKAGRIRFHEWADQWKSTTINLRPSTRVRDFDYLDRYLIPTFGHMTLSSIDHATVTGWVRQLITEGPLPWWDTTAQPGRQRRSLSPATAVKAEQLLRKIMSSAVVAGRIHLNPCDRVPLPRIEREEMRVLTPDDITCLAAAIDVRYRALVLVAAFGGLRIGELAGLRRERVDAKRSGIHVAEIVVEVREELTYGPPKTRAGRRFVTLPRSVMQALLTHLDTFTGAGSGDFVFPSPWGGALRVPAWRRRFWVPGVETAALAPLTPHELRHTAIALWIASGANPLEVSRRAGHASTAFTHDRYGHLFPEADQSVADRLELLISDGRKTDEVWSPAVAKPDLTLLPGRCRSSAPCLGLAPVAMRHHHGSFGACRWAEPGLHTPSTGRGGPGGCGRAGRRW